jgi:hypothetical protein
MFSKSTHNARLECKDQNFEDEESHTDKYEAEDLTTVESGLEALPDVFIAKEGNLNVGGGSNHHADVTSSHGGTGTDAEADSGVRDSWVSVVLSPGLIDSAHKNDGEKSDEDDQVQVFSEEEGSGTSLDICVGIEHALVA